MSRLCRAAWVAALCATACASFAQSVVLNWARTDYSAVGDYRYKLAAALPDGRFVVAGYRRDRVSTLDEVGIVRCVNSNGSLSWEREFTGLASPTGIKIDQLAILADSSIYLTAIGNSGMVTTLDSATGATLQEYKILESVSASGIAPDGTTYFAAPYGIPSSGTDPNGDQWSYLEYYIRCHRISNTLVPSSTVVPAGQRGSVMSNSALVFNKGTEGPHCRFVFSPGGQYMVYGAAYSYHDTPNAMDGSGLYTGAVKFDSTGSVAWNRLDEQYWDMNMDNARLTYLTMTATQAGVTALGNIQVAYQVGRFDGTSWTESIEAREFSAQTGSPTHQPPAQVFDSYRSQNGFQYSPASDWGRTRQTWSKLNPSTMSVLWSISSEAAARLPFMVLTGNKNGSSLDIERWTDSSAMIDSTLLRSTPDKVNAIAVNQATGDAIIVGDKTIPGRTLGWIGRISQAPLANSDSYSVVKNGTLNAPTVLANDRFVSGAVLTRASAPKNGVAVLNPDGSFTYQPRPGYVGSDSFTYRLFRNGVPSSAVGTVFIRVNP